METIDRILLSLDMKETTDAVIARGLHLARCLNAELILLHAMEDAASYDAYIPSSTAKKLTERISTKMRDIEVELGNQNVSVSDTLLEKGSPCELILSTVEKLGIDLVIMGATRKNIIERILGTTAEKVCRGINQPVWFVHPQESAKDLENVLCAVDFSPASRETLNHAVRLCRYFNATLNILHVFPLAPFVSDYETNVWPYSVGVDPATVDTAPDDANAFDEYLKEFDLSGLTVRHRIQRGRCSEEIIRAVDVTQCDLLIAGAYDKDGVFPFSLRGTIEGVLRKVPCSFLSIKHQEGEPDEMMQQPETAAAEK